MKAKLERLILPGAAWAVFADNAEADETELVAIFVGGSALARAVDAATNSEETSAIAWPAAITNATPAGAVLVYPDFAEELEPDSDATRGEAVLVLAPRVGLEPRAWFDEPVDDGT